MRSSCYDYIRIMNCCGGMLKCEYSEKWPQKREIWQICDFDWKLPSLSGVPTRICELSTGNTQKVSLRNLGAPHWILLPKTRIIKTANGSIFRVFCVQAPEHTVNRAILGSKLTYWDCFAYTWGGLNLRTGTASLTYRGGPNSYLLGALLIWLGGG
jgi:hypothetical protein